MSQSNFSNPPYSTLKNEFKNILQKSISDHKELRIGIFNDRSEILSLLGKINAWEQCLEIFNKFCNMIENPEPQRQSQPQSHQEKPSNSPVSDGEIVEG